MAHLPRGPAVLSELFRRNLDALMRADRELNTQAALAKASRIGQRSVSRILRGEQSPTLDMVGKLAHAFGLEPWQMLVPDLEPDNPPITKQIDKSQQELLARFRLAAQELARYEIDRTKKKPGDPA